METQISHKDARCHLRLSKAEKHVIQQAAYFKGLSLSSFILTYALASAKKVVSEDQKLTLSEADQSLFFNLLENPPAPTNHLLKAAKKFMKSQA